MNFSKRRAMYSLDALARVEGPNLSLRLIKPDDCFYVHKLRSDPKYNRYLSAVNGSPDEQRRWIEAYKERRLISESFTTLLSERTVNDAAWSVFMLLNKIALLGEVGSLMRIKRRKPRWRASYSHSASVLNI